MEDTLLALNSLGVRFNRLLEEKIWRSLPTKVHSDSMRYKPIV